MKKLLVALLLFFSVTTANAQAVKASFGVKAAGFGTLPQTEITPVSGLQMGGGGGAFFGMKFFNVIGVEAEALFSHQVATYQTNSFGKQTWLSTQQHIMVPVVLQLWLGRGFAFEVGYQQAIVWDGNLTCVQTNAGMAGEQKGDNGMFDYGSLVAGMTINMGKVAFLNLRYTSALDYSYVMTNEPSKNMGFQVGLGLRFFNSKKSVFK